MKPIRVAIMLPKLSRYGGAEQFGYRLAEYLASDCSPEFDVTFICAKQDGTAPPGVRVTKVGRPVPGKFGKTLWFALAAEYARRIGKFDVSIGLGNTVRQDILRISGGPTTAFWKLSEKAYAPGFKRSFKQLSRMLSPGKQLGRIIEALQVRHSRCLVANSEFVRNLARQVFPHLQTRDIRIISNEPDTKHFLPVDPDQKSGLRREFSLPEHGEIILTAGTNFRLKGVHVLIRALPLLPKTFHLTVAGGRGSGDLIRLAQKLGVGGQVHFLGRIDNMPRLYQAADIFVLNTFYDACANAVLEALACGLPVISTACNGSSAYLCPEAVLPDPADETILAHRISQFIHKPSTASGYAPPRGLAPYADLIRTLA